MPRISFNETADSGPHLVARGVRVGVRVACSTRRLPWMAGLPKARIKDKGPWFAWLEFREVLVQWIQENILLTNNHR